MRLHPRLVRAATSLAVAGLALLAGACGEATPDAATVGDDTISRSHFEEELQLLVDNEVLAAQIGSDGTTLPADISAGWLERLVYQIVVDDEFAHRGLEISEEDRATAQTSVEQGFGEAFVEFPESFQTLLVDRTARAIALQGDLAAQEPTDAEMQAWYDAHVEQYEAECPSNVGVSHILVETQAEADDVVAELEAGADFAALASERSGDPGSAAGGGSLGCYVPGSYVPEFEAGVEAATPGVPTEPVESQFGFHVILVEEPYVTFENLEARVAADLVDLAALLAERLGAVDVEVDSRYGTWVHDEQGTRIEPPAAPAVRDGRETPDTVDPLQPPAPTAAPEG